MKVTLIDYTQDAVELLIFTKSTRLKASQTLRDIAAWPHEQKMAELEYMKDTIKSSWEFINYTFNIEGVSRSFTHQFVRTRTGRYAQESQRTIDASSNGYVAPAALRASSEFYDAMNDSFGSYNVLLSAGVAPQDARAVLPTATSTSIIAQFSLRTLHEMAGTRLCTRTQGEYQDVFRAMKDAVVAVHPWAADWMLVACANDGVCIFPRYKECPIQKFTFNKHEDYDAVIARVRSAAELLRHEARPVAKEGRTM